MEGQLFTLLPAAKPRWKSFLVGWSVQALSLAGLLVMGARVHQELISDEPSRVTNLVAYEPLVMHEERPATQSLSMRPKLPEKSEPVLKTDPPVENTPAVATLVVTRQVRNTPEYKRPESNPTAPELKLESKMPTIPNTPSTQIVAVGTFSGKSPVAAPAKPAGAVQAGGFGDANGVPAAEHHGVSNINAKGSFDLPAGPGHGSGAAGTSPSVVAQSGFGNPVAIAAVKTAAVAKPSSGTDAPVEITFEPKPNYTEEGRKQKVNGEVRLQVLFSADGRAHVIRVVQGLGYGLDEQAVKAAEQIKFKPALREGQPIDSTALVHIIFELIS